MQCFEWGRRRNERDRKGTRTRKRENNFFHGDPSKQYQRRAPKAGPSTGDFYLVTTKSLFDSLARQVVCKVCNDPVKFLIDNPVGLAFTLRKECSCSEDTKIQSCKTDRNGRKEVNVRACLAMKLLGHGRGGLKTFCGIMNLPKPVSQHTDENYTNAIMEAAESVAARTMAEGVENEKELTGGSDLTVSGDGTWRKAGFASLQGVATLIGARSGKVVDYVVKNKFCKACHDKKKVLSQEDFVIWEADHREQCSQTHTGSSGRMESDGIKEMFLRSISLYDVKYVNYVGDGDSKTYPEILAAHPYDVPVNKLECVGHVQKRMGTRLRKLKKEKGLGGRNNLTDQRIDQLTAYFGKAIRSNSDSVREMYKAIWATYYHESSTDQQHQHHYCPQGKDSWCKYRQALAEGRPFKHKPTMPRAIWDHIKLVYEALSSENLLSRCLGGYTQNRNESLNSKIWKLAPKKSYSGANRVRAAAAIAIVTYNDQYRALLDIFDALGLEVGGYNIAYVDEMDKNRTVRRRKGADTTAGSSQECVSEATDSEDEAYYQCGIAD